MSIFANPLRDLEWYQELEKRAAAGKGPLHVTGLSDTAKAHFLTSLCEKGRPWKLVVTYDEARARELLDDCRCFTERVWLYPARDLLFFAADIRGFEVSRERISIRRRMAEEPDGVVITTIDGLMDRLEEPDRFRNSVFVIDESDTVDLRRLSERLVALGYERTEEVDGIGQFSVRGGIIDIFPPTEDLPVRIELWDTDIDSIRSFDPESQRSVERLTQVEIYPAREQELGGTASFLRYWDTKRSLIFLDEPQRTAAQAEAVEKEFREGMAGRLEAGQITREEMPELFTAEETIEDLKTGITVLMTGLDARLPEFGVSTPYSAASKAAASFPGSFELLLQDLRRYRKERWRVVLLTQSRTRAGRLAQSFRDYELSAYCPDSYTEGAASPGSGTGTAGRGTGASGPPAAAEGAIMVVCGNLHRGFEYPLIRFAVLSEKDLFRKSGEKKRRRKQSSYEGSAITSLSELSVGDYVVHEDYGLGIYRGIEKIEADGVIRDFVQIEYRGGDNCYVPATKLDIIQKYAAGDAPAPKLSRLGGPEWGRTRSRVKSAVAEIAKELVSLYASRMDLEGHKYGPDTVWQKEFEEMFPFEETEDQLKTIEDVKADMEQGRIMDRLVCGDVGYGKTEIALRAAFKAVQESRQVIYLVPTTILAQQHYNTFVQRMANFPVRIGLLCRFRSPAEQRKTLQDFSKGLVDIIIGTHRVLSKDIKPKALGLLIIDEEQRFGVKHKEKLKELKRDVNVLTLTATPIPRTLHMSLAGIRELSILKEPPMDRHPIQTYVMEYSEETVREAIRRELSRGGQVYFVYNRVNGIAEVAAQISRLLPDAEVAYAHGQMNERELEQIMLDFMNGDIDVLVSTTIIETGLDIPNVNTIIIQDADRLGLSQLYQLRGRVGRSSRTAYAFLLYRRGRLLTEEAEKRLKAIREFTELGSGIRIAMRDLEIRGAGNVLGAEQHGHMQAVGYDMYCKLLNQAVRLLTGKEEPEEQFQTTVEADADAYIPDTYIKYEDQKLDIYKRIALVETDEDDLSMQDELMDRFGEIPRPVRNLLLAARIRSAAHRVFVTEVKITRQEAQLLMIAEAQLNVDAIPDLVKQYRGKLSVRPGEQVRFILTESEKYFDGTPMLEKTLKLLREMETLMPENA